MHRNPCVHASNATAELIQNSQELTPAPDGRMLLVLCRSAFWIDYQKSQMSQ